MVSLVQPYLISTVRILAESEYDDSLSPSLMKKLAQRHKLEFESAIGMNVESSTQVIAG